MTLQQPSLFTVDQKVDIFTKSTISCQCRHYRIELLDAYQIIYSASRNYNRYCNFDMFMSSY